MPWHAHPGPPKPVRRGRPKCCTTCAQWRLWPAGPIWTGRTKLVSTSNCRCSRSVAPANSPTCIRRRSANTIVWGWWCRNARTVAPRRYSLRDISRLAKAQQLSQEEGINLAGIARILSLEEENRELRRQVERLRRPAGSSVFAADADGGIVEIERSRRARMWRRQIQVDARQLPSRESVEAARVEADVYDTRGGGVAGENEGIERGKPVSQPISRSIVLWGID